MKKFLLTMFALVCCTIVFANNDNDTIPSLKETIVKPYHEVAGHSIVNDGNLKLYIYSMNGYLYEVTNAHDISLNDYPHGFYIITDEKRSFILKIAYFQHN